MHELIAKLKPEIERYVTHLFQQHENAALVYHNLEHTQSVVTHAMEIAGHYNLSETALFILYTAAWFHDTGQLFSQPKGHEEESVRVFDYYISALPDMPPHVANDIRHCILATKMPQHPHTLMQSILCDADLYHLGTASFSAINELVKKEASLRNIPIKHWNTLTIMLLKMHSFHTDYARAILNEGKAKNLASIQAGK